MLSSDELEEVKCLEKFHREFGWDKWKEYYKQFKKKQMEKYYVISRKGKNEYISAVGRKNNKTNNIFEAAIFNLEESIRILNKTKELKESFIRQSVNDKIKEDEKLSKNVSDLLIEASENLDYERVEIEINIKRD